MSNTDVKKDPEATEEAAPGATPEDAGTQTPEESDVKVPIETEADDEEAMVEAAKRAGEAAAEADIKADAEKRQGELQAQLTEAQDAAEAAKKQAAEAKDRLLRLQADWDNYRRRTAQERLDEKERASEKLVTSLLPVLDDMERAIEHASGAAASDGEDNQFDQFVAGVQAVHDKMLSILAKEGVEVIDPAGEAFNPMEHQAVGRVEDTEQPDETVAAVYMRGYRMGGKVIREAMVQVTYGGPKREAAKADK